MGCLLEGVSKVSLCMKIVSHVLKFGIIKRCKYGLIYLTNDGLKIGPFRDLACETYFGLFFLSGAATDGTITFRIRCVVSEL